MTSPSITISNVVEFVKVVKYFSTLSQKAIFEILDNKCTISSAVELGSITKTVIKITPENPINCSDVSVIFEVSSLLNNLKLLGKIPELKFEITKDTIKIISRGIEEWELITHCKPCSPQKEEIFDYTHSIDIKSKEITDYIKRLSVNDDVINIITKENKMYLTTTKASIIIVDSETENGLNLKVPSLTFNKISKGNVFSPMLIMCFGNECPVLFEYTTKDEQLTVQVNCSTILN